MDDNIAPYTNLLPPYVCSYRIKNFNGLNMHVLDTDPNNYDKPTLLLLHGFPELAFSWRKLFPHLVNAGFRLIVPDQRGYGLTTGWDSSFDCDLGSYRYLNLVSDVVGLLSALRINKIEGVIGHDFGAYVAAYCSLLRPDLFQTVILMSMPFAGPPLLSYGSDETDCDFEALSRELASLPRPRKHYQIYFSTKDANNNMLHCPQGVHDFLRAYFHFKSADFKGNDPYLLTSWKASEMAELPTYYIMDADLGMAETVSKEMPNKQTIANCSWLSEKELKVYSTSFKTSGFQGGLNWYRARFVKSYIQEQQVFSGLTINIPSLFIAGRYDWGIHQSPGALKKMQKEAFSNMVGCHLLDNAGHWVQQEQPEEVANLLIEFFKNV